MLTTALLCYFMALFELVVWLTDYPPYFNRGAWKFFKEEDGKVVGSDISRNVFFILAMVNAVPLFLAGLCAQRRSKWWMIPFAGLLAFFTFQQTRIWWIPYFTGEGHWYSSKSELAEYRHNIAPLHKILPRWNPNWQCVPDTEHTILYVLSWLALLLYVVSLVNAWRRPRISAPDGSFRVGGYTDSKHKAE